MARETKKTLLAEHFILTYEHNPYGVNVYKPKKYNNKVIVFPIFNYQTDKQFIDLINPIVEKGYKVIAVNLLNRGDRVLFFNYYYQVFATILDLLYSKKLIGKEKEEVNILGIGPSANIASYMNFYHNDNFKIRRILLLSPINRYKGVDYKIAKEVGEFKIPTHIFYGQFDHVNDVNNRYQIFANGKRNKNVHFYCYPACGHYLYYKDLISMELEKLYRNSDFDLVVGETKKNKVPFLPSEVEYNESFFHHFFAALNDLELPKRIALLTDVSPIFINGVEMVIELLQKELNKLGYETYVVSLWKKYNDFGLLPNDHYIPVIAKYARLIKGYKELNLLSTFDFKGNARMLAMFDFNYLHLHTEYSMGQIATELSKITGIKMPYTYHTLWKMYYENKFGHLMGDITYKTAKKLLFNKVYKICPTIIVPSRKSYEILKADTNKAKDVRIIPSPINSKNFIPDKNDKEIINQLRDKYKLKDKKVLGYVGRVSTEKNIFETIENISKVVKEIPNIVFMIVGVGDALEPLKKYAKKLHVEDHIIYTGRIPNSELRYYYSLFDVFVTASNFETQGLTYFEAATSGTLILAKEDKAIEGVFRDGYNAYIYNDFYSWVERIEFALFGNNKQIIDNAKETIKEYSQDKWALKMRDIYISLNEKKN